MARDLQKYNIQSNEDNLFFAYKGPLPYIICYYTMQLSELLEEKKTITTFKFSVWFWPINAFTAFQHGRQRRCSKIPSSKAIKYNYRLCTYSCDWWLGWRKWIHFPRKILMLMADTPILRGMVFYQSAQYMRRSLASDDPHTQNWQILLASEIPSSD